MLKPALNKRKSLEQNFGNKGKILGASFCDNNEFYLRTYCTCDEKCFSLLLHV